MKNFIDSFSAAAREAGLGELIFYILETHSRLTGVSEGKRDFLQYGSQKAAYIRANVNGLEGSIFVEDWRPSLFEEHFRSLRETAAAMNKPFKACTLPELSDPAEEQPEFLPPEEVTERLTAAEQALLSYDARILRAEHCMLREYCRTVTMADGSGRTVKDRLTGGSFMISAVAKQGSLARSEERSYAFLQCPELTELAIRTAAGAVGKLETAPCPSSVVPAVLDSRVVCELLDAFLPAFYQKNAEERMSTLAPGMTVGVPAIRILEDPTLPGGLNCRRFDDEGVPTAGKELVSGGVLRSMLRMDTGNAFKSDITADPSTGYTNIIMCPGEKTREELLLAMGEGLLITGVSGVFAGAHFSSGAFSLIAQGYRIREGQRRESVSQITISGNFFELLTKVEALGCDLGRYLNPAGCLEAPSLYVRALSVSGKDGVEQ